MKFLNRLSNSKLITMRMMKSFMKKRPTGVRNIIEEQRKKLIEPIFVLIKLVKSITVQKVL